MKSEYALVNEEVLETVANIYDLSSTELGVRYLHACARFSTKWARIKAMEGKNFATWPHLTVDAAYKYFPEIDEMQ